MKENTWKRRLRIWGPLVLAVIALIAIERFEGDEPKPAATSTAAGDDAVAEAFRSERSDFMVELEGEVQRLLPDDDEAPDTSASSSIWVRARPCWSPTTSTWRRAYPSSPATTCACAGNTSGASGAESCTGRITIRRGAGKADGSSFRGSATSEAPKRVSLWSGRDASMMRKRSPIHRGHS